MGLISKLKTARAQLDRTSTAMMALGSATAVLGAFPLIAGIAGDGSKVVRAASITGGAGLIVLGGMTVAVWAKINKSVEEG